jgi:hypothetical protein
MVDKMLMILAIAPAAAKMPTSCGVSNRATTTDDAKLIAKLSNCPENNQANALRTDIDYLHFAVRGGVYPSGLVDPAAVVQSVGRLTFFRVDWYSNSIEEGAAIASVHIKAKACFVQERYQSAI